MPPLIREETVTCEKCGGQTTRNNIVRHKKRCSARSLFRTQCPSFSTTSQGDLNYHIAKKHRTPEIIVIFKCKVCYQEFPEKYALRQHKNTEHGFPIKAANVDPDVIINEVDDLNLKAEVRSCQHFFVDTELERARHKVFNFAIENLNATIVHRKTDHFLNNLQCEAKVNLVFGFILKNIEEGGFRCF